MKYLKLYEAVVEFTIEDWVKGKARIKPHDGRLCCSQQGITSLKGIENFTKLWELACDHNYLTSLDGIEHLTELTSLKCYNNKITSFKGIPKTVEKLFTCNNEIDTLEPLENCTELRDIEIEHNLITSLKPLENCKKLNRILCRYNYLKNLDGIENLPVLQHFFCHPNPLESITMEVFKKINSDITYSYPFQKEFLEENPEKIIELKYFNDKIKEEYKDLIELFGIKV